MTERHALTPDRPEAGRYEIRLTGHLDAHWTDWFDGLAVTYDSDGTTVISGQIVDQAALHGLLQRVRDLGLPLVSVSQVQGGQPGQTPPRAIAHQAMTKEI
jgi:hypothetical protein